jgi:hypothetical protein
MQSSVMWRPVDLVRTDVSEEYVASIFKADRISELGTKLALVSRQDIFSRNVGSNKNHTAPGPRRRHSSGTEVGPKGS